MSLPKNLPLTASEGMSAEMCGIAGVVGVVNEKQIERCIEDLSKRGPDASGQLNFEEQTVTLIHTRLSILDLDHGHQPMKTKDGRYAITFNGEIYNHKALRKVLVSKGAEFQTRNSDTEVILEAFRYWGVKSFEKLDGMFAFGLLDRRDGKIYLVRDRMGQKPLFYTQNCGGLIFGSELTALKSLMNTQPVVKPLSLAKFAYYGFVPAPNSIYEGIFKLSPGAYLEFDIHRQNLGITKYFNFRLNSNFTGSLDEAIEEFDQLFKESISKTLAADVEVGILLSGGIDSSLITAFASVENQNLQSFNISFEEKTFDESSYATQVAKQYNVAHNTQKFELPPINSNSSNPFALIDEPIADPSLFPTYQVSNFASQHVKVVLGGDGADELFFGYSTFMLANKLALLDTARGKMGNKIAHVAAKVLPISPQNFSLDFKLRRLSRNSFADPALATAEFMSNFRISEINQIYGSNFRFEEVVSEALEISEDQSLSPVEKMGQYFSTVYLPNNILTKSDRASMLNGLEVRSPFLSNDLIGFACSLPLNFKVKNSNLKLLLRRAASKVLPATITNRSKKGFGIPLVPITRGLEVPKPLLFKQNRGVIAEMYEKNFNKTEDRRFEVFNTYALHASKVLQNQLK